MKWGKKERKNSQQKERKGRKRHSGGGKNIFCIKMSELRAPVTAAHGPLKMEKQKGRNGTKKGEKINRRTEQTEVGESSPSD